MTSADPIKNSSQVPAVFLAAAYETLIRLDADGDFLPGIAEEWSLSEDARTAELVLRDDVEFQDGTPLDADAVVANLERARGEGSLLAGSLSLIDAVSAVDATRVRIEMNRPGGDIFQLLTGYAGMIASPAAIEDGSLDESPVGAGPFRMTSVGSSKVTYEQWDDYWDAGTVEVDGLEIHVMSDDTARLSAVRSGQVDATFIRPGQRNEAEAAGLEVETKPRVSAYGLLFNPNSPAFGAAATRQAVSMAIDREAISHSIYDGGCSVTTQLFPENYWAHDDDVEAPRHDPEAAADLIAGEELSFTLLTPSITDYQQQAEVIQAQLAEAGIAASIEVKDSAEVIERTRSGDYDAAVFLLQAADPDPTTFAQTYFTVDGVPLTPELPSLIDQARSTAAPQDRSEPVQAIHRAVNAAGSTAVGVCIPDTVFAFRPGVEGLTIPVVGPYSFRDVEKTDD
ncbi:ABC transporter substrate-binding protein [Aeromicrobium phragmitis]|nr:ABC transporter substrate-binding protein [Aeromicrobium phragmitis]